MTNIVSRPAAATLGAPGDGLSSDTPPAPRAIPAAGGATPAARVLAVDDEVMIQRTVRRILGAAGHLVDAVGSADEALARLRTQSYDLLVADVKLGAVTGLDLVSMARDLDPDLAIVVLTGLNDAVTASHAFTCGALDYVTKPFDPAALADVVQSALQRRTAAMEERRVDRLIRAAVVQRTAELEREKEASRTLTIRVAEALINAMEAKDVFLRGHSLRVGSTAAEIANELGLDDELIEQVRLAGQLQDLGKIGIREAVLNKEGVLTAEEREHVREHVRIGMDILAPLTHLGDVLRFVHEHHERLDGSGYPRGLRGDEISIGGRILAVSDEFDALTSHRPHRQSFSRVAALEHLRAAAGRTLDARVFDALCRILERRTALTFIDPLE